MPKNTVIRLRVSEAQKTRYQAVADKSFEGNLSLFLENAANLLASQHEHGSATRQKASVKDVIVPEPLKAGTNPSKLSGISGKRSFRPDPK